MQRKGVAVRLRIAHRPFKKCGASAHRSETQGEAGCCAQRTAHRGGANRVPIVCHNGELLLLPVSNFAHSERRLWGQEKRLRQLQRRGAAGLPREQRSVGGSSRGSGRGRKQQRADGGPVLGGFVRSWGQCWLAGGGNFREGK